MCIVYADYLEESFVTNKLNTITMMKSHILLEAVSKRNSFFDLHTSVKLNLREGQVSVYRFLSAFKMVAPIIFYADVFLDANHLGRKTFYCFEGLYGVKRSFHLPLSYCMSDYNYFCASFAGIKLDN